MDRRYVIVSNEHKSWPTDALLFWGKHTEDNQKRSFSGYTVRWDKCEKYTREELEKWRGTDKENYPFFDEINPTCYSDFHIHDEVLCTMEELESIGFILWSVVCRA